MAQGRRGVVVRIVSLISLVERSGKFARGERGEGPLLLNGLDWKIGKRNHDKPSEKSDIIYIDHQMFNPRNAAVFEKGQYDKLFHV